ncbi:hypothetical protein ACFPN7_48505 [Amycolatopsis halotolerans]|uniref:hypothetical protein n=1 Tax=Amycolatopsis halotolerans TaxID=330083 RepID=UPI0036208245
MRYTAYGWAASEASLPPTIRGCAFEPGSDGVDAQAEPTGTARSRRRAASPPRADRTTELRGHGLSLHRHYDSTAWTRSGIK